MSGSFLNFVPVSGTPTRFESRGRNKHRSLAPIIFGQMGHRTIKLLISVWFITITAIDGFSQVTIDSSRISAEKELNFAFTDKRGIKADDGIIYLVEKDGQTLTAFDNSNIKWTVNIIKTCGQPKVGKPEIRHMKLTADKIQITFGKHDFASVDIKDGKVKYLGAD